MTSTSLALALALPLLLAAAAPAATVLLTNGDFAAGTNPAATGWTRVDGAGVNASPSNYGELIPGLGNRSMQIKSDGGNYVQQALTLTDAGAMDAASYAIFTVGFDYGYRRDAVTNGPLGLRISLWNVTDNVELTGQDLVIADPGVGANSLASTSIALNYDNTAGGLAGDQIAIRFTSTSADLGGTSWQRTAAIDNIAITAVPEPASILLGTLGLAGLLRRGRR